MTYVRMLLAAVLLALGGIALGGGSALASPIAGAMAGAAAGEDLAASAIEPAQYYGGRPYRYDRRPYRAPRYRPVRPVRPVGPRVVCRWRSTPWGPERVCRRRW